MIVGMAQGSHESGSQRERKRILQHTHRAGDEQRRRSSQARPRELTLPSSPLTTKQSTTPSRGKSQWANSSSVIWGASLNCLRYVVSNACAEGTSSGVMATIPARAERRRQGGNKAHWLVHPMSPSDTTQGWGALGGSFLHHTCRASSAAHACRIQGDLAIG